MVSHVDPLTSYAFANILEACLGVAYVSNITQDVVSCIDKLTDAGVFCSTSDPDTKSVPKTPSDLLD